MVCTYTRNKTKTTKQQKNENEEGQKRREDTGKEKKRNEKETKTNMRSGRRPNPEGTRLLFAGTISPRMISADGPIGAKQNKK